MIHTRVIPCLLLKGGGLVKTVQFKDPRYVGDPINAVKIFNDKECHELVFLDITATDQKRRPRFELIADIASECFMPFAYGGGIRNLEDVREILRLGVEKVVINSYFIENPAFVTEAAEVFGSQSIVVSIDAKKNFWGKYEAYTNSGMVNTKLDPAELAVKAEKFGAGEIIINSVDRDGTMKGYDIDLIKKVAEAVTIPVVALGGAGSSEDFGRAVKEGKASAVAAGSLFVFFGKHRAVMINFPGDEELLRVLS